MQRIGIRKEREADVDAIGVVVESAFLDAARTSHTEQFIVDSLRRSKQLTISLVATDGEAIVGHVAVSPVVISCGAAGWYGIGPVSVLPEYQRRGVGTLLMAAALSELQRLGGVGCVVLGDPGFYGRFGFRSTPGLELPGVPAEFFQAVAFKGDVPAGTVQYHEAFNATGPRNATLNE